MRDLAQGPQNDEFARKKRLKTDFGCLMVFGLPRPVFCE